MAETPRELFARHLRETRDRCGWSQQQVANRLEREGVKWHPATIAKIEAGTRGVSLDEALALAKALDVPPVELIIGHGAPVAVTPETTYGDWGARDWFAGQYSVDDQIRLINLISDELRFLLYRLQEVVEDARNGVVNDATLERVDALLDSRERLLGDLEDARKASGHVWVTGSVVRTEDD